MYIKCLQVRFFLRLCFQNGVLFQISLVAFHNYVETELNTEIYTASSECGHLSCLIKMLICNWICHTSVFGSPFPPALLKVFTEISFKLCSGMTLVEH